LMMMVMMTTTHHHVQIRWAHGVTAWQVPSDTVLNLTFVPTFLDAPAGAGAAGERAAVVVPAVFSSKGREVSSAVDGR
jgi:hypothetical protein